MVDPNQIAQNIVQALQQQSVGSGPANHVVRVMPNADGSVSINLEHEIVPAIIAKELATAIAKGVAIGIAPFLDGAGGGGDDHLIKAAPGDTLFRTLYEKLVQGNNILLQIVTLGAERKVRVSAVGSSRMPRPLGPGNPGVGPGLSWDDHEHPYTDPQALKGTLFYSFIEDRLNKDDIFVCYTGGSSCFPYLFDAPTQWTEVAPGVMRCNFTGALDASHFDGFDPEPALGLASPLLGKRVLAYVGGLSSGESAYTGPWIVEDIGGYWMPYLDTFMWVETNAILRRDPDYAAGSDFLTGMTFHIQNGTLFGGKYIQYTTTGAVTLGDTPLDWDVLDTYTPVGDQWRLLTAAQVYQASPSIYEVAATPVAGTDSAFFAVAYLDTLLGTPKVGSIPAGKWTFRLLCRVLDLAGDTTIRVILGKENESGTRTPLFYVRTTPIRTTEYNIKEVTLDSPEIVLSPTDRLYVYNEASTTSTHIVSAHLMLNDGPHSSRIETPLDTPVPGSMRHPDLAERFTPDQHDGYSVSLAAARFSRNLSGADTDVQKALETLDRLVVSIPAGVTLSTELPLEDGIADHGDTSSGEATAKRHVHPDKDVVGGDLYFVGATAAVPVVYYATAVFGSPGDPELATSAPGAFDISRTVIAGSRYVV